MRVCCKKKLALTIGPVLIGVPDRSNKCERFGGSTWDKDDSNPDCSFVR